MSKGDKEDKEQKRKKRLRDLMLHLQAAKFSRNSDVGAPSKEKPASEEKPAKSEEFENKMSGVYKSIELRRREANDRWNRFAGTSGGGGRGR